MGFQLRKMHLGPILVTKSIIKMLVLCLSTHLIQVQHSFSSNVRMDRGWYGKGIMLTYYEPRPDCG